MDYVLPRWFSLRLSLIRDHEPCGDNPTKLMLQKKPNLLVIKNKMGDIVRDK